MVAYLIVYIGSGFILPETIPQRIGAYLLETHRCVRELALEVLSSLE